MSKSGFIRKTLIIAALTWAWFHFFLSGGHYVRSPSLLRFGRIAVVVMAVWGVITLLAHRMRRGGE
jgi:hypothetical protein